MNTTKVKPPLAFLKALTQQFAPHQIYTDPADCWVYGYDNSRRHALPDVVIFALSHEEIVIAVKLCYEYDVPIIARGRASNTVGGVIPIQGGVILATERMNHIIDLDVRNRFMIVEPGVLNATIQTQALEKGYFWAPEPTSSAYSCVGGNLACNAAGPRSLKYGSTRDNVLGLTAVIGTGETIECGVYTSKSAVGYDLTRLMIGSEGTLGIISKATLKLIPLPEAKYTLRAFYSDMVGAAKAVTQIMSQPITPCACEFIDGNALSMIRQHAKVDLPANAQAMILIEVDGSQESLSFDLQLMEQAAIHPALIDIKVATTLEESKQLWTIRKSLSQALRSLSPHKLNEDVVVPIAQIPELLAFTQQLAAQFDITIVNFGHAGNGNIHVNLLIDPLDPIKGPQSKTCLNLLFDKVIALKGSISGEHGIGIEKKAFMEKELSPSTLHLMRGIKAQFDPKGILNPGKLFP